MNSSWSGPPETVYLCSLSGTDYLDIQCHAKLPWHNSTIITNLSLTLFCIQNNILPSIENLLLYLVQLLNSNLQTTIGDFSHASARLLAVFDSTDPPISPTRVSCTLERIISKHPQLFCFKSPAPILTSGYSLPLLKPKVYFQTDFRTFSGSNQINVRVCTLSGNQSPPGDHLFVEIRGYILNF